MNVVNHKRKRPKNRRSGCLLCKPWKVNGFGKRHRLDGERFSDASRRRSADLAIRSVQSEPMRP